MLEHVIGKVNSSQYFLLNNKKIALCFREQEESIHKCQYAGFSILATCRSDFASEEVSTGDLLTVEHTYLLNIIYHYGATHCEGLEYLHCYYPKRVITVE